MADKIYRCAIYTRKSSEEGLEQSFNSLDAQREACLAYIISQKHEGWKPIRTAYDDGGYSGGNLQRPALKQLIEDIKAKKLDVIVVYKVDRLTRSLMDFAKIVEIFDAHQVSFVSVTQQFNTTTSMGRLTLNVLLSFAQFEREVTGERIRDKVAASKRKGMWMGGNVPLGYDLKDRKLLVNTEEADLVRDIYRRYLQQGCVTKLKIYLDNAAIKSKARVTQNGKKIGGRQFSRGALYNILQNRLYLGEIAHKGQIHPGEHQAIVPRDQWEKVQAQLFANNQAKLNGSRLHAPSLLVGLLYDENGHRFTPVHTVKNGKRYRYYASQRAIKNPYLVHAGIVRVPAGEIERLVLSRLRSFFTSRDVITKLALTQEGAGATQALVTAAQRLAKHLESAAPVEIRTLLRRIIARCAIKEDQIEIHLRKSATIDALLGKPQVPSHHPVDEEQIRLLQKANLKRTGRELKMVFEPDSPRPNKPDPQPSLIRAIARAYDWHERITNGQAEGTRTMAGLARLDERYVSKILRCAFLAPSIVEAILEGRQPRQLTVKKLLAGVPLDWHEQEKILGIRRGRLNVCAESDESGATPELPSPPSLPGPAR